MSRCAFLVDECLPRAVDRGLSRRAPSATVLRVGEEDAPATGSSDDALLAFFQHEQRILVTADRSTMPAAVERHLTDGGQTWGVLVVRPESSLSQLLEDLELLFDASELEEWINQYEYVPF